MSGLSNVIERFIKQLLDESKGSVEIQRNEMAAYFECSPSQINYVLTTRFTPYRGYYVESRRGGGGYIRIIKVNIEENEDINSIIIDAIGNSVTKNKSYDIIDALREEDILTDREADIMKAAIGDRALSCETERKNSLRADILKNILLILVK